ncbi:MAG TPA: M81 family metallopeptidase, partial [Nitrolancea sp.]|nr:M81 family metallopeptidase [Nitrolancea sp.]
MRIAIGGIAHETNTFCTGLTTMEAFTERESGTGAEITARHQGVRSYIGGMLDAAADLGIKVVPTFYASATPSGTISRATFDSLLERLLSGIRAAMPVDAVALALHGAGVAEGADDIESVILTRVRELVGEDTPIVVTLDLHGNMTQEMLAHADALFGVHLYPHTDAYERGREAVELIPRLLSGEVKPAMHLTMLPMMIPTSTTNLPPASEVNARCWEWERREGVLDCAFFHGFPTTDIPRPTVSVLAMTNNDPALAREIANDVAGFIWEIQERFRPVITPPEEAIRQALAAEGRPVVINDTADNPGGGAPGDATHLLRAMLEANLQDACFGYITDSETAAQAHAAGVGATIQVRLGGKTEP